MSIIAFAWYTVADSASRIGSISSVSRNYMAVEVHDGLSGSGAAVHADVVAVGRVVKQDFEAGFRSFTNQAHPSGFNKFPGFANRFGQHRLFLHRQVEKIRHFPLAHNQQMSRTHREPIVHNVKVFVFEESLFVGFRAEYTHRWCRPPVHGFSFTLYRQVRYLPSLPQRNYRTS